MEITFLDPGAEEMIRQILECQTEGETAFWSEPLYFVYPQLDRAYAKSLSFDGRKDYIRQVLLQVYAEEKGIIREKTVQYARHWARCKPQITAALTDAFGVDCAGLFPDIRCHVSLNPIEPRFLRERRYDTFYQNSERGAIGSGIHELIHFVWFFVWNRIFGDDDREYERPSLKWILSEMVVESIMKDPRLASINPYFSRENGGCIYPYFFDMMVEEKPITDTLDGMYRSLSIEDFMRESYFYCQKHEAAIRAHIQQAEG